MHGDDLYRIDTTLATETKIGDVDLQSPAGMIFVNACLVIYDQSARRAVWVDATTAHTLAIVPGLGAGSLFPIMFAPHDQVVTQALSGGYD